MRRRLWRRLRLCYDTKMGNISSTQDAFSSLPDFLVDRKQGDEIVRQLEEKLAIYQAQAFALWVIEEFNELLKDERVVGLNGVFQDDECPSVFFFGGDRDDVLLDEDVEENDETYELQKGIVDQAQGVFEAIAAQPGAKSEFNQSCLNNLAAENFEKSQIETIIMETMDKFHLGGSAFFANLRAQRIGEKTAPSTGRPGSRRI